MDKIGLIAGVGRLPVEFARAASGMGFAVIAAGVVLGVDPELKNVCSEYHQVTAGELSRLIAVFKEAGVTKITLLGKVTKELMFAAKDSQPIKIDAQMQKLLAGLKDNSDDTIMLALVKEFALAGIGVLDQTEFIKRLLPQPGVLTKRQPTEAQQQDIEFGFQMAREIGRLDIGQTVIVKDRAVMAVEAIEGTDACIRRGGALGVNGVTVAKTAKPKQDSRFDMPGVGPDTLAAMIEVKAAVLAIEAGKTLLIDRAKVVQMADEHGIAIVVI
jgi:DUF1009 family protein